MQPNYVYLLQEREFIKTMHGKQLIRKPQFHQSWTKALIYWTIHMKNINAN